MTGEPCSVDLECYRNDGHRGAHAHVQPVVKPDVAIIAYLPDCIAACLVEMAPLNAGVHQRRLAQARRLAGHD